MPGRQRDGGNGPAGNDNNQNNQGGGNDRRGGGRGDRCGERSGLRNRGLGQYFFDRQAQRLTKKRMVVRNEDGSRHASASKGRCASR